MRACSNCMIFIILHVFQFHFYNILIGRIKICVLDCSGIPTISAANSSSQLCPSCPFGALLLFWGWGMELLWLVGCLMDHFAGNNPHLQKHCSNCLMQMRFLVRLPWNRRFLVSPFPQLPLILQCKHQCFGWREYVLQRIWQSSTSPGVQIWITILSKFWTESRNTGDNFISRSVLGIISALSMVTRSGLL